MDQPNQDRPSISPEGEITLTSPKETCEIRFYLSTSEIISPQNTIMFLRLFNSSDKTKINVTNLQATGNHADIGHGTLYCHIKYFNRPSIRTLPINPGKSFTIKFEPDEKTRLQIALAQRNLRLKASNEVNYMLRRQLELRNQQPVLAEKSFRVRVIYNSIIIKARDISLATFNASKSWLQKLKQPKQIQDKEDEMKKDDVKPIDKPDTKAGDKTALAKLGVKRPAKADKTARKTGLKPKSKKVVKKKTAPQDKYNPDWPGRWLSERAWFAVFGLGALLILLLFSLCVIKAVNWMKKDGSKSHVSSGNDATLPENKVLDFLGGNTSGICTLNTNFGSIEASVSIPTNSSTINGQAFGNVVVTGDNSSNNGPRNTTLNISLLSLPNLQGMIEKTVVKTNVVYVTIPAIQNSRQVVQNYDSRIRQNYNDDPYPDFSDLGDIPSAIDLVHDIEQRLGH